MKFLKKLKGKYAYRTKSITTRIETGKNDKKYFQNPDLIVQSPLQQGLKLLIEYFTFLK